MSKTKIWTYGRGTGAEIVVSGLSISLYGYDGNGNLITDSGKDLTITWNPVNLPQYIEKPDETPVEFWYTFGGEKIRMLSGDGAKDYLGGAEFTGEPEAYYHPPPAGTGSSD